MTDNLAPEQLAELVANLPATRALIQFLETAQGGVPTEEPTQELRDELHSIFHLVAEQPAQFLGALGYVLEQLATAAPHDYAAVLAESREHVESIELLASLAGGASS